MNILQLLCVCSVVTASFNDTESIPLVNNNKAALKAEIDFSEFNSKMKNLVTVQVPADIKGIFIVLIIFVKQQLFDCSIISFDFCPVDLDNSC